MLKNHIVISTRMPGVVNCPNHWDTLSPNNSIQEKLLAVIMKIMYFWQENCQPRPHKVQREYAFKWLPHLKRRINDLQNTRMFEYHILAISPNDTLSTRYRYEFVRSIRKIRYTLIRFFVYAL